MMGCLLYAIILILCWPIALVIAVLWLTIQAIRGVAILIILFAGIIAGLMKQHREARK